MVEIIDTDRAPKAFLVLTIEIERCAEGRYDVRGRAKTVVEAYLVLKITFCALAVSVATSRAAIAKIFFIF